MTNNTIFDMDVINGLKEMGDDFFADLVSAFVDESQSYFQQLKASLPVGDIDTFRRAAHTLKSNANNFGASRMAELAKTLEVLARENKLNEVGDKVSVLEAEYERVAQALKEM